MSKKIDEKYLINVGGKRIVSFRGLLDLAHKEGLCHVATSIVPSNIRNTIIFKAIATFEDKKGKKVFSGYGEANPNYIRNERMKECFVRLAETRAIRRALTLGCNLGEYDFEDEHEDKKEEENQPVSTTLNCSMCNKTITAKVHEYSMKDFNIPLCMDCQKAERKRKEREEVQEEIVM